MTSFTSLNLGAGWPVDAMSFYKSASGDHTTGTIRITILNLAKQTVTVNLWIAGDCLHRQELGYGRLYKIGDGGQFYPMADDHDTVRVKVKWKEQQISYHFVAFNKKGPANLIVHVEKHQLCLVHNGQQIRESN
jgi:hypothetical protein